MTNEIQPIRVHCKTGRHMQIWQGIGALLWVHRMSTSPKGAGICCQCFQRKFEEDAGLPGNHLGDIDTRQCLCQSYNFLSNDLQTLMLLCSRSVEQAGPFQMLAVLSWPFS